MTNIQDTLNAPVIFAFSSFYDDLCRSARLKNIPWDGYAAANLITESDLALISQYDKQSNIKKTELITADPNVYISLFVRLLSALLREGTVQYLLAVIDDVIQYSFKHFHQLSEVDPALPYAPFLKLLSKDDVFTRLASSKILTFLLCTYEGPEPIHTICGPLFTAISDNLRHSAADVVDMAVQNVQSLLSIPSFRIPIYDFHDGKLISGILDVLRNQASPQIQYQIIFCLWLLSFERDVAKEIEAKFHIITPLTDISKGAIKEKVIRVVMALFRNLIQLASHETVLPMIGSKLLPFLDILKQRKLTDTEISDDIEYLQTTLRESLHQLSSFDEYVGEVQSGKLEWSPAHESELFWKQNAAKLADKDNELVRTLARLLNTASDPLILSVAAHDLGQFIKHYASGKKILQDIGAKHRLMEIMTHENADVRYQALMAVQALVSQSWAI